MPQSSKRTADPAFHQLTASTCSEEDGYLLLGVVVMVALVLVALAVAAPSIAKDLRRDKEVESERRAQQYVRAIRLYYRKFNAYPPSIDALKQSNNIRFLRQEYVDPLTGKSDWRILHLGEQKTTIKVFFGQELGALAGSGGIGSGLGSASSLASSPAGASAGGGSSPLGAALVPTQGVGSNTPNSGPSGSFGATGATGGSGTLGSMAGFASSGSTGSIGGGGAIIGVGIAKTGTSILTPNKQTTYETWEFWYDPRIEQLYKKGQMNAGMSSGTLNSTPASGLGATGSTGPTGFQMPMGGSGTPGSAGGLGASPTAPTSPSAPGSSTTPQ